MDIYIIGLYVDDIRPLPVHYSSQEWDVARTYDEAITKLQQNKYTTLSLDHDIASWNSEGREMTGYDIALWLAQRQHDNLYIPSTILVHSANPVGVANIQSVIDRYLT